MARSLNRKCLECSKLSVEEARQLHGPQDNGCWDDSRCHKRRSHYRSFGMRGDRVTALLPQILEEFSSYVNNGKRFTSFAVVAHRHARDCPLKPCPFHPQ